MAYGAKTYTLREYFISFKDGQGEHHEIEVSEKLFLEFRQMERRNRNLQQWNQRHREFNEVWDETLYRRALRVPKTLDESMIEKERNELFYQIGEMEHCTASAVQKSVSVAKEKVKAEMRKYLQP